MDWLIKILTARTVLITAAISLLFFSSAAWCQSTSATVSATAHSPGFCGHNYAMLMTGAEPNSTPQLGSTAGFPGALTAIVGVGVIQFSRGCKSISGELIYNDGDVQFLENVPTAGLTGGPATCYSSVSFVAGLPCFDGGNHFTNGSVTTAGAPPGMALLQFTANFNFFDFALGPTSTGSMPFAFTIHETAGDFILVGNTVPSPTAPVLTLTMQQQDPEFNPVPTTFGRPPYLGNSAIICNGYGADNEDAVASILNGFSGNTVAGYDSAVGSVQIFSSAQAGGLLSFNSNDNIQNPLPSPPSPQNNTACDFTSMLDPYDPPAAFADGTSNISNSITSPITDPTCTNAALGGAGFTTSQVVWGPDDSNSFAIVTGLTATSFPFVPPGEMSTCTFLANTPAGSVSIAPFFIKLTENGTTGTAAITVTNTSPVGCDITATLGAVTGTGTLTLTNGTNTQTATVEGGSPELNNAATLGVSCTQPKDGKPSTAEATVTVSSVACQLEGATSIPVICRN
jgi:hypothetical protein